MAEGSGKQTYFCIQCQLLFSLRTRGRAHTVHCPYCTNYKTVEVYDRKKHKRLKREPRRSWTIKEQSLLEIRLQQGFRPRELAIEFDRTQTSIRKKATSMGYYYDEQAQQYMIGGVSVNKKQSD